MENTEIRDEKLWKIAKGRASFKKHLLSYITVNAFLWVIWFFTGHVWNYFDNESGFSMHHYGYQFPWPLFVMFFWGIGLFFNFLNTYVGYKDNLEEKEYQKLLRKNNL